ncbi:MAG: hypothetical protein J2P17_25080, partial [Mycobacterium sp.]|nr:hypothetical protein [Mycobacterium sp.]
MVTHNQDFRIDDRDDEVTLDDLASILDTATGQYFYYTDPDSIRQTPPPTTQVTTLSRIERRALVLHTRTQDYHLTADELQSFPAIARLTVQRAARNLGAADVAQAVRWQQLATQRRVPVEDIARDRRNFANQDPDHFAPPAPEHPTGAGSAHPSTATVLRTEIDGIRPPGPDSVWESLPRDGNCMFHALARILGMTDDTAHEDLRAAIVESVYNNTTADPNLPAGTPPEHFMPTADQDTRHETYRHIHRATLDGQLHNLLLDGQYTGPAVEYILPAAASEFGLNLTIRYPGGATNRLHHDTPHTPIHTLLRDNTPGGHYHLAVHPNGDPVRVVEDPAEFVTQLANGNYPQGTTFTSSSTQPSDPAVVVTVTDHGDTVLMQRGHADNDQQYFGMDRSRTVELLRTAFANGQFTGPIVVRPPAPDTSAPAGADQDTETITNRRHAELVQDALATHPSGRGLDGLRDDMMPDPEAAARFPLSETQAAIATATDTLAHARTVNAARALARDTTTTNATWWQGLDDPQQEALIDQYPHQIGNTDGLPPAVRDRANRLAIDRDRAALDHKTTGSLSAQQKASRTNVRNVAANLRIIEDDASKLTDFYSPSHHPAVQVLAYDPTAFGGKGRIIVSVGDIEHAESVSWHISGFGSTMARLSGIWRWIRNLYQESVTPHQSPPRLVRRAAILWLD